MLHEHEHELGEAQAAGEGPVQFTGARPILNVASVADSLAYYCERLGFEQCWAWSNEEQFDGPAAPTFAEVRRGRLVLSLAQQEQRGVGMWLYVDLASLSDLESLYREYLNSGARIVAPPADRPWGMREMVVQDLDGHTLRMGASLGQA